MNTNAVFIDIDGVIQSYRVMATNNWQCYCGGKYVKEAFDPVAVKFLIGLSKLAKADLILNSTWAHGMTDASLAEISEVTGLPFNGFVPDDVSETKPFGRERRCLQYLAERPHITGSIFLDDEAGHYAKLRPHAVIVEPGDGLTYGAMVEMCVKLGVDIGDLRKVG